ncbi:hypothetical protein QF037_008796 [Streptomyces canus]|nr:hypothetical protein [Streptomyces canus]MDQ0604451.1 hypothetical protein [Streptomyces canus]
MTAAANVATEDARRVGSWAWWHPTRHAPWWAVSAPCTTTTPSYATVTSVADSS